MMQKVKGLIYYQENQEPLTDLCVHLCDRVQQGKELACSQTDQNGQFEMAFESSVHPSFYQNLFYEIYTQAKEIVYSNRDWRMLCDEHEVEIGCVGLKANVANWRKELLAVQGKRVILSSIITEANAESQHSEI